MSFILIRLRRALSSFQHSAGKNTKRTRTLNVSITRYEILPWWRKLSCPWEFVLDSFPSSRHEVSMQLNGLHTVCQSPLTDEHFVWYWTAVLADWGFRHCSHNKCFFFLSMITFKINSFKINRRVTMNRCTSKPNLPYSDDGDDPFGPGISSRSTTSLIGIKHLPKLNE